MRRWPQTREQPHLSTSKDMRASDLLSQGAGLHGPSKQAPTPAPGLVRCGTMETPPGSLSHISVLGGGHYSHPLHFICIWAPSTQNRLIVHLVLISIIVSHPWPASVCSLVSMLQESHPSPPKPKNPPAGGDRGSLVKRFF